MFVLIFMLTFNRTILIIFTCVSNNFFSTIYTFYYFSRYFMSTFIKGFFFIYFPSIRNIYTSSNCSFLTAVPDTPYFLPNSSKGILSTKISFSRISLLYLFISLKLLNCSIYKNRTHTSWVKAKCADHYTKILYSPNKTCKGEYRHLFMQVNNTKVIILNIIMCNQKITLYAFH